MDGRTRSARAWPSVCGLAAAAVLAIVALAGPARAQVPPRAPDLNLTGTITRADFQTYPSVPFTLPTGVDRLVVAFDYDTRDQRTVIDLGIADPSGFRGASGGNKASLTIGPVDATPSYLPGPLTPGIWHLALAVPNIRAGVTTHWHARLWFLKGAEAESLPGPAAARGPGWYRGDLHLHSAHSDGSCASQSGRPVPCPLFRTLEAAAARQLDFVAITEHNTASHAQVLREAAPYFDRMVLIPAREITTFFGHFNVLGVTDWLDFRIVPGGEAGFDRIADRVHALGGLVSINHPGLPSGENCMGCGWTMPAADLAKADAVEVVNGGSLAQVPAELAGPVSGVPFWLRQLAAGRGVTAVGGSDNHGPERQGPGGIGAPVTVVYAQELSQPALLAGIRSGRVFIALDPAQAGLRLDFAVSGGGRSAAMGGALDVPARSPIALAPDIAAPAGATVEVLDGEVPLAGPVEAGGLAPLPLALAPGFHPVRLVLRGADGQVLALSNAVRLRIAP